MRSKYGKILIPRGKLMEQKTFRSYQKCGGSRRSAVGKKDHLGRGKRRAVVKEKARVESAVSERRCPKPARPSSIQKSSAGKIRKGGRQQYLWVEKKGINLEKLPRQSTCYETVQNRGRGELKTSPFP